MDSRPKRQSKKSAKLLDYELDMESSGKKKGAKMETGKPSIPKLTIKFDKDELDSSRQFVAVETKVKGKPGRKRKKPLEADVAVTKKAKVELSLDADDEDYTPTDTSFDAGEESEGMADVAASSESKRQRKLPAKFADDDYAVESDLLANKAAKFFETKKAEQKAANALAKQEAAKSDKKKRNRVPNGYTMWCNSYRAKLQAQCPGMSFGALNKKLGEVWSSIPLKEKNQWNRRAKRLITQGTPKNVDSLKFLGSKGIASLVRNKCLQEPSKPKSGKAESITTTNLNPVYKVTETEPVDVAAYLGVMAETMSAVGAGLANTADTQVHGSMSLLLDSLLCSMSALVCLTQQVPELDEGIDPQSHKQRMSDVSYFLPRS